MTQPKPPPPAEEDDRHDEELIETGQEEVFSRTEVETGRIEHRPRPDAPPK